MSDRRDGTMNNKLGRCDECIFWLKLREQDFGYARGRRKMYEALGECRRRAPSNPELDPDLGDLWPQTLADQWCGEGVHDTGEDDG